MLVFKFDIDAVEAAFGELMSTADITMTLALSAGAILVAEQAKDTHRYTDRTGHLTSTITPTKAVGSYTNGTAESTVYAGARHAAIIEYGSKAHRIPKSNDRYRVNQHEARKKLKFKIGGRTFFRRSVRHPGTVAYKYLEEALDKRLPDVEEFCAEALALAFERVGFSVERG